MLAKKGDDIRIDWGYLYVAAANDTATRCSLAERKALQQAFVQADPSPANEPGPTSTSIAASISFDVGAVARKPYRGACCWPTTTCTPSST